MDINNLTDLGVGATVGLVGMWFMFKLCQSILKNLLKDFKEVIKSLGEVIEQLHKHQVETSTQHEAMLKLLGEINDKVTRSERSRNS